MWREACNLYLSGLNPYFREKCCPMISAKLNLIREEKALSILRKLSCGYFSTRENTEMSASISEKLCERRLTLWEMKENIHIWRENYKWREENQRSLEACVWPGYWEKWSISENSVLKRSRMKKMMIWLNKWKQKKRKRENIESCAIYHLRKLHEDGGEESEARFGGAAAQRSCACAESWNNDSSP